MKCISLSAASFRNIQLQKIDFCDGVNVLWGQNAQGKSNILEGIYFFARGRSFRGAKEKEMIAFGEKNAQLSLDFVRDRDSYSVNLSATFSQNAKKVLHRDGAKLSGMKEMIGDFRAVLFCPAHLTLVSGGPALRRSFMDIALSQLYPAYLDSLSRYNRALLQRNALIKKAKDCEVDSGLWEIYAEQMASLGAELALRRYNYMSELDSYVKELFYTMTEGRETPELLYKSILCREGTSEEILSEGRDRLRCALYDNVQREIAYGATLYGIQKDDFEISLSGREARLYASQGQQRSLALAMKLAEGEAAKVAGGEYPVFLLDDVLSELDSERRHFVMSSLSGRQIIVSSCEPDIFAGGGADRLIKIENGKAIETIDGGMI